MRSKTLAVVRGRRRRRRLGRSKVLTTFLALLLLAMFSVGASALDQYTYYSLDLPDPSSLNPYDLQQATQILDRNGKLLYLIHGSEIRTVISLDRMAPVLRQATVDLEDKNFYEHHGVDYQRLAVAAYQNLTRQEINQGASTITQQLVKRKYLTAEQSVERKIREALLATELENRYSKDQILEAYLNTIFYGHQAYGIEAASEIYFGKHAGELNLNEASLLAGLPEQPSYLDPLTEDGMARVRDRQKLVLRAMQNQGDITQAQVDEVVANAPTLHYQPQDQVYFAPHFVQYVRTYLEARYGRELVDGGGLKVTTSLDLDLQTKAEDIVRKQVARFGRSGVNNGALEAINPNTGEILAYVGSADYNNDGIDGKYDNISNPGGVGRQPGSSFKPYVYLTAFANGMTPSTTIEDTQGSIGGTVFHDFDNRSEGNITLRRALVESRNIPAIKLLQQLGYGRVFQTASALGIGSNPELVPTTLKPELGTAIGSSEVHMLEHTAAYGVFATEGIYRPPAPVLKITDANGAQVFTLKDTGKRVAGAQATYVLDDVLLGYAKQWSLSLPGPAAGKSGTTDDGADLWYMGYTPDLVVGTWMAHTGKGVGLYPLPGLFGVTTAAHMFEDFMRLYYAGKKIPEFAKPALIQGPTPCRATPSSPGARPSVAPAAYFADPSPLPPAPQGSPGGPPRPGHPAPHTRPPSVGRPTSRSRAPSGASGKPERPCRLVGAVPEAQRQLRRAGDAHPGTDGHRGLGAGRPARIRRSDAARSQPFIPRSIPKARQSSPGPPSSRALSPGAGRPGGTRGWRARTRTAAPVPSGSVTALRQWYIP